LTGIAQHESSYANTGTYEGQFSRWTATRCTNGTYVHLALFGVWAYWPTENCDGGSYMGLMMVPPSGSYAWDWIANTQQGATILQGHYAEAISWGASQNSSTYCKGKGKLPALTALQNEHNGLAFYALGKRSTGLTTAYYVPDPTCTKWMMNKRMPAAQDRTGSEAFADFVYKNLR
jgi:hypothetical protein